MNCRRRGKSAGSASKQVGKDAPKSGNDLFKSDGKHGMEYRPVKRKPDWQGSSKIAKTD